MCSPGYAYWGKKTFKNARSKNDPSHKTFKKIGHFSAVVWKGAKNFGFAIVKRKLSKEDCKTLGISKECTCWWGVGHYNPPGNISGKFAKNVEKGSFDSAKNCKDNRSEYAKYIKKSKT